MKKLILLLVILISFTSCRSVKKSWVEENFAEKSTLKESLTVQNDSINKRFQQISESFQSKFQEFSNSSSEKTSENESENTSVTGSITAEDGKEKSVTIGGTTIKSNGANVTFETNSSKTISKELEKKNQELTKALQWQSELTENLQNEVRSLKSEFSELKSQYESSKSTDSKDVKKSGIGFRVYVFGFLIFLVLIAIWIFRKRIPFLNSRLN